MALVTTAEQATGQHAAGSLVVFREQAQRIADEVLQQVRFEAETAVSLRVSGGAYPFIVENAFLAALEAKGLAVSLASDHPLLIEVFLLTQNIGYEEHPRDGWKRAVTTVCEVRLQSPRKGEARYLGMFEKTDRDVVDQREAVAHTTNSDAEKEASVIERIVTPVVLIVGAVIVVYLFFTVRN